MKFTKPSETEDWNVDLNRVKYLEPLLKSISNLMLLILSHKHQQSSAKEYFCSYKWSSEHRSILQWMLNYSFLGVCDLPVIVVFFFFQVY